MHQCCKWNRMRIKLIKSNECIDSYTYTKREKITLQRFCGGPVDFQSTHQDWWVEIKENKIKIQLSAKVIFSGRPSFLSIQTGQASEVQFLVYILWVLCVSAVKTRIQENSHPMCRIKFCGYHQLQIEFSANTNPTHATFSFRSHSYFHSHTDLDLLQVHKSKLHSQ